MAENIKTPCCCGQMSEEVQKAAAPSSERVKRLRDASFDQHPSISIERALLETEFYREHEGKLPMPVLRGANFKHLCENKTIYIGKDELIVGERGPFPKAVSTFPELTCHSRHDFEGSRRARSRTTPFRAPTWTSTRRKSSPTGADAA